MPKIKLTKTIVDAASASAMPYELRDTLIPGFLLKVAPTSRKVFIVAYVAANGQRRKPAIGRFGEITVEQARMIAQDWLADGRKGNDPSAAPRTVTATIQTGTLKSCVLCRGRGLLASPSRISAVFWHFGATAPARVPT